MTISTLAIASGALALLVVAALAAVVRLGLRVDRADNEEAFVPAAPRRSTCTTSKPSPPSGSHQA